MKREFIRVENACASEVDTCRENSWIGGFSYLRGRSEQEKVPTLSTLFPTRIFTTESETYVSSSEYHFGRASNDSRFDTSYTIYNQSFSS